MRLRRALPAALASAALLIGSVAIAAPSQASSGGPITDVNFGMHIPQISQGEQTTVNEGTVRLWDSGVAWGQVEQKKGKYWWNGLDAAIQNSNQQNLQILYVLGSTPTWAASNTKQGKYPNKGAASMPANIKDWRDWVTAVVKRYGSSIDAYQIWNEANLTTFWMGTPDEMVTLTKEAAKIIRKYDPSAKIVAASTTVRLQSAYKKFFPAYLKGLKKAGWPVDVISVHTYPESTAGPDERAGYIKQVQADMKKAGVPAAKKLWDTEINYGIAGPGARPRQVISGATAAAYVAETYLQDVLYGIDRAYWYYWYNNSNLVGIQMYTGTDGATGYQTARNWLSGAFYSCTAGTVNTCQLGDNIDPKVVAWTEKGSGTFTVPANATSTCNALNQCTPVTPGSQVTIGNMPQWFGVLDN